MENPFFPKEPELVVVDEGEQDMSTFKFEEKHEVDPEKSENVSNLESNLPVVSFPETYSDRTDSPQTSTNPSPQNQEPIEELPPLSYELQQGRRILKEIMSESQKSVNWPFMDPVDVEKDGLWDYNERIQHPMWLKKMKDKIDTREYATITQFVSDFRLMLENCYRYNGPDHPISKRGQRLETVLEQKLALLSRDLREKTSITATSGQPAPQVSQYSSSRRRGRSIVPHDSSMLLNQLREEEAARERETRKQQILERKQAQEAYIMELQEWEDKLLCDGKKEQLKAMWELPQIGHFLFLCQEQLNVGEVIQYELERSFLMAPASSTMHCVMTSLISTPYQRTRLDKKPSMPYSMWNDKVRARLNHWYKILKDNDKDISKTSNKIGIDENFFKILGTRNPMRKKNYDELTYYQKVWVMKALCDYCSGNQESIQDAIESQPVEETREYQLGMDAEGNTYIHFPQFCGADLRIYRQAPLPMPSMKMEKKKVLPSPKKKQTTPASKRSHPSTPKKKKQTSVKSTPPPRRPSRLRQVIKPVLKPASETESSQNEDSGHESDMQSDIESTASSQNTVPYPHTKINLEDTSQPCSEHSPKSSDTENESKISNKQNSDSGTVGKSDTMETASSSPVDTTCKDESNNQPQIEAKGKLISVDLSPESSNSLQNSSNGKSENGDEGDTLPHKNSNAESAKNSTEEKTITSIELDSDTQTGANWSKKNEKSLNSDSTKEQVVEKGLETGEEKITFMDQANEEKLKIENSANYNDIATESSKVKDGSDTCDTESNETPVTNTDNSGAISNEKDSPAVNKLEVCTGEVENGRSDIEDVKNESQVIKNDHVDGSLKADPVEASSSTSDVNSSRSGPSNGVEGDVEEEEEDSEDDGDDGIEIEGPELGNFELVASSVEELRQLVDQFAEPEPIVQGRGKKQKIIKAPPRKRCVADLHERLLYLLKELEPWEQKLISANKKAKIKMRKEQEEYQEELNQEKLEDIWDSEESVSEDSSEEEEESEPEEKEDTRSVSSRGSPSSRSPRKRVAVTEPSPLVNGATKEEELYDVSSRGRVRKRRLIPNNIEDQGLKRKQIKKEEVPVSIEQKTGLSALQQHLLSKITPQGLQTQKNFNLGRLVFTSASTQPTTTQSLLSNQNMVLSAQLRAGPAVPFIFQGQTNINPNMNLVSATSSTGQQILLVPPGVTGQTQPTSLIQALLANTKSKTTPAGQNLAAKSIVTGKFAPQGAISSTHIKGVAGKNFVPVSTPQLKNNSGLSTLPSATANKDLISLPQPSLPQGQHVAMTAVATTTTNKISCVNYNQICSLPPGVVQELLRTQYLRLMPDKVSQIQNKTVQEIGTTSSTTYASAMNSSTKEELKGTEISNTVLTSPAEAKPTRPIQVVTDPSQLSKLAAANPGLLKIIQSPQKYAGNVTVKTLLENRASQPKLPESTVTTSTEVKVENSGLRPAPVSKKINLAELSKSPVIESAVKAVVTSVQTSLPTVQMKVPPPSTMPSFQPRNVTQVTQAMKSPIPAAPEILAKTKPGPLKMATHPPASNSIPQGSPLKIIPPGTVLNTATPGLHLIPPSVLQTKLKVGPQGNVQLVPNQMPVQAILTPQGLIIPRGALPQNVLGKLQVQRGPGGVQQVVLQGAPANLGLRQNVQQINTAQDTTGVPVRATEFSPITTQSVSVGTPQKIQGNTSVAKKKTQAASKMVPAITQPIPSVVTSINEARAGAKRASDHLVTIGEQTPEKKIALQAVPQEAAKLLSNISVQVASQTKKGLDPIGMPSQIPFSIPTGSTAVLHQGVSSSKKLNTVTVGNTGLAGGAHNLALINQGSAAHTVTNQQGSTVNLGIVQQGSAAANVKIHKQGTAASAGIPLQGIAATGIPLVVTTATGTCLQGTTAAVIPQQGTTGITQQGTTGTVIPQQGTSPTVIPKQGNTAGIPLQCTTGNVVVQGASPLKQMLGVNSATLALASLGASPVKLPGLSNATVMVSPSAVGATAGVGTSPSVAFQGVAGTANRPIASGIRLQVPPKSAQTITKQMVGGKVVPNSPIKNVAIPVQGGQQKLLLFNIGGQLVSGQGLPVTVNQGQLQIAVQQGLPVQQLVNRPNAPAVVNSLNRPNALAQGVNRPNAPATGVNRPNAPAQGVQAMVKTPPKAKQQTVPKPVANNHLSTAAGKTNVQKIPLDGQLQNVGKNGNENPEQGANAIQNLSNMQEKTVQQNNNAVNANLKKTPQNGSLC